MIEKICDYKWTMPNGALQRGEYYYEDGVVLIYRNHQRPDETKIAMLRNGHEHNDAGYDAAWMRDNLANKNYDKLFPATRKVYDFLNARLGG